MEIKVECSEIVASVYRAVGRVMAECPGADNIGSVHVLGEGAVIHGGVNAMVFWEFPACDTQIEIFRRVWDEETGICAAVIVHESPFARVDSPKRNVFSSLN